MESLEIPPVFLVIDLEKMFNEQRNILFPFPEAGQEDGHNVQSVKEVLAKCPFLDLFF